MVNHIPIPQLTIPAWTHWAPGAAWVIRGPPLSPCLRKQMYSLVSWFVLISTNYAARIFARVRRAEHMVDDTSRCVIAIISLALFVGHDLHRHLLEYSRLASTYVHKPNCVITVWSYKIHIKSVYLLSMRPIRWRQPLYRRKAPQNPDSVDKHAKLSGRTVLVCPKSIWRYRCTVDENKWVHQRQETNMR